MVIKGYQISLTNASQDGHASHFDVWHREGNTKLRSQLIVGDGEGGQNFVRHRAMPNGKDERKDVRK